MKLQSKMLLMAALLVLAMPMVARAEPVDYVGTETCKTCHISEYNKVKQSIHQKLIREASGPGNLHGNLDDPKAPSLSDLTYAIGGWYKEESYIKKDGNAYNVTNFEWDPIKQHYANDKSIRNWLVMCAGCHTTGYNTTAQTFKELNIGCEACHGQGSKHAASQAKGDIVIDKSSEGCGYCHIRATQLGGSYNFPVGYVLGRPETLQYIPEPYTETKSFFPDKTSKRHRQQFLDVKISRHYSVGVTCVSCHDPHTSGIVSTYDALPAGVYGVKIFNNSDKTTQYVAWDGDGLVEPKSQLCKTCHTAVSEHHEHNFTVAASNAQLTCTDCHMPDVINVDSTTLRGALTTHTFRALGPGNSLKYGPDSMPNSCTYRCHQDRGADKTARANWAYSVIGDLSYEIGPTPVGTFTSEMNPAGQTFFGDGAVYGNGYLQPPPFNRRGDKCLQCHQPGGAPIPDKSSYLRTGHGNMLKKVTSPPQVWRGANGQPHPATNPFGHVIDWTTGKVNLGGFCDVGGFEGQFDKFECEDTTACTLAANNFFSPVYTQATCEAGGGQWKKGTWTPAERWADITYFVGDWMGSAAGYIDTGITGAGLPANKFMMADGRQYGTCGSCHNAGYKANDYTRPQPFADYPNFPKDYAGSGVGGSWVLDGIQCERCHDATNHFAAPFTATVPRGGASTALCSQCHIRAAAYEGSANPNAATQPTAYPIGASATNFGGHLIGKQFLNSPHGLFTGPYGEIATATAKYNSRFMDGTCSVGGGTIGGAGEILTQASCEAAGGTWTAFQGGCTTCHDVHQSTIPQARETFGAHPMKRECIDCHSDKADLSAIRHPNGEGTPQAEGAEACVICHMPKPGGTGLSVHVFRINTDHKYSTFPADGATTPGYCSDPNNKTKAACLAAGKAWSLAANSAPDGTYANAVWVDLGLACGKCHYEGGGAKVLSTRRLARFAKRIHGVNQDTNTAPTAAMTASPAVTGNAVSFVDNSTDVDGARSNLRIAVDWGDWTITTGTAGSTFVHTYASGGTFTIRHTATDTGGLTGYESVSVVVGN